MKKFVAGGILVAAGVTAVLTTTFGPGEETGKYNLCYVVAIGTKVDLVLGEVLEARVDLTQDFSSIEKGEEAPAGSDVRFTVRTVSIVEAEANSINAQCRCLKVNDLENPTGLVGIP